jgi:hypothetical protein
LNDILDAIPFGTKIHDKLQYISLDASGAEREYLLTCHLRFAGTSAALSCADIGSWVQGQMVSGLDMRRGRELRAARIDHDEPSLAPPHTRFLICACLSMTQSVYRPIEIIPCGGE